MCDYIYVYCVLYIQKDFKTEFFSENFYIPLLPLNLRCPHIVQSFPDEIFVSGNRIPCKVGNQLIFKLFEE